MKLAGRSAVVAIVLTTIIGSWLAVHSRHDKPATGTKEESTARQDSTQASTQPASASPRNENAGTVYTVSVSKTGPGTISIFTPHSKQLRTVLTSYGPIDVVTAPPGTANAGLTYVGNTDGTLTVLTTSSTLDYTLHFGGTGILAMAPASTPNAGTLYVLQTGQKDAEGALWALRPNAKAASRMNVGMSPGSIAIAPAGTVNAGTVYVANYGSNNLSILRPDAAEPTTVPIGPSPGPIAIQPADTAGAGNVYIALTDEHGAGSLAVVQAGATRANSTKIRVGPSPYFIEIAPAGTLDAGTTFVANVTSPNDAGSLSIIKPGSSTATTVALPGSPSGLAIAPANLPNGGTVYVTSQFKNKLSIIEPNQTAVQTLDTLCGTYGATVAPAGVANAGTVYFACSGGDVGPGHIAQLKPDSTAVTVLGAIAPSPQKIYVAP